MANTIKIGLTVTETGLKMFRTIPTFNNLLYPNQITALVTGDNSLVVNHYVYGKLLQMCGCTNNEISVSKL